MSSANLLIAGVILVVSISDISNAVLPKDQGTLELVHVVHRHGDRTPDVSIFKYFPSDRNANNTFPPMGSGALVNQGKLRTYRLGAFLRRRYNTFLGNTLTPDVMDVRTTDYERTKASALMVMAGLWPPTQAQQWATINDCSLFSTAQCVEPDQTGVLSLLWQPIPSYYERPLAKDPLSGGFCDAFFVERNRVANSPKNHRRLQEFLPLLKILSDKLGIHINDTQLVFYFYDTVIAEYMKETKKGVPVTEFSSATVMVYHQNGDTAYGIKPLAWVTKYWPEIKEAAAFEFEIMYESIANKQRGGGAIVHKILSDSLDKIHGVLEPKGRKLFEYSAHDISVMGVLTSLGGEDHLLFENGQPLALSQPIYGSAVIVELYRIPATKQGAIRILYYNQIDPEPVPLKIAGCGLLCPLETALSLTAVTRVTVDGYLALCGL